MTSPLEHSHSVDGRMFLLFVAIVVDDLMDYVVHAIICPHSAISSVKYVSLKQSVRTVKNNIYIYRKVKCISIFAITQQKTFLLNISLQQLMASFCSSSQNGNSRSLTSSLLTSKVN